jgi:uncharacterized repeat protein (TIGR03803 family)
MQNDVSRGSMLRAGAFFLQGAGRPALALITLVVGVLVTSTGQAQTNHKVLYSFKGVQVHDGFRPFTGLVRDAAGNFYGTTSAGGVGCYTLGCGTVYKLNASGEETILHSFTGGNDGAVSYSSLLLDSAGNLYGTTLIGGIYSYGTIFKVSPMGKFSVVYSFTGDADGSLPEAGLIEDAANNLYGTTYWGGSGISNAGYGTVFKLAPNGVLTTLYTFTGSADGAYPSATLVRDAEGNLYGTTEYGGVATGLAGYGVVFRVSPDGRETVLHTFVGAPSDGQLPYAGVIRDSTGTLYGTTVLGGSQGINSGAGTVFEIKAAEGETVLYNFTGGADGGYPQGILSRDATGALYGTTEGGGLWPNFPGTVFRVDSEGVESVLYSFQGGPDGAIPVANLLRDSAGNLYSTTAQGGASGSGTVFALTY